MQQQRSYICIKLNDLQFLEQQNNKLISPLSNYLKCQEVVMPHEEETFIPS